MKLFSTEITHSTIESDNPLYQRTRKSYELIKDKVIGKVLEVGCGEGYGIDIYYNNSITLTVVDKSKTTTSTIKKKHPEIKVVQQKVPPFASFEDHSFDTILAFQVIEHIKNDHLFLSELNRILKPGGTLYLTTPNINKTIAPNPWHFREYSFEELKKLIENYFNNLSIQGIRGNEITDTYYAENKKSVSKILSFDIFKIHKLFPPFILRYPYEILNRHNRKKVLRRNPLITQKITSKDYSLAEFSVDTLDFFCEIKK